MLTCCLSVSYDHNENYYSAVSSMITNAEKHRLFILQHGESEWHIYLLKNEVCYVKCQSKLSLATSFLREPQVINFYRIRHIHEWFNIETMITVKIHTKFAQKIAALD